MLMAVNLLLHLLGFKPIKPINNRDIETKNQLQKTEKIQKYECITYMFYNVWVENLDEDSPGLSNTNTNTNHGICCFS